MVSLASFKKLADGSYLCTEFKSGSGAINLYVEGAPRDSRISIGGVFARLFNSRAQLDTDTVADGKHTVFLHTPSQSCPLMLAQKRDGVISPIQSAEDVFTLNRKYAELYERLLTLEKDLRALEKTAFESVVF